MKRSITISTLKEIPFLGATNSKCIESGYVSKKYFQRIEIIEWAFVIFMTLQLLLLQFYVNSQTFSLNLTFRRVHTRSSSNELPL